MKVTKTHEHLVRIGDESFVPVATYSRAIDEIYCLRALLASEARILEAHGEYKTFPKSRRGPLADSVEAMRRAARGLAASVLRDNRYRHYRSELRNAGADDVLTNHQWEAQAFPDAARQTAPTTTDSAREDEDA